MLGSLGLASGSRCVGGGLAVDYRSGCDGAAGWVGDTGRGIDAGLLLPLLREAPGIEDGVAEEVGGLAVVFVASGLHGEVERTGAGVLGRWRAGDDLKLVDGVEVDALGDETVVALLVDGRGRHAVDVELTEVVAGSADDGHTDAGLCAGSEGGEGSRVALRVVHLQRKVGVGGVLHHEADGRVGGIEDRRSGGDVDGLCRLADGQDGIEAEDAEGVDDQVVLLEAAKSCRCDAQGVGSGRQGSNVEET